MSDQRDRPPSWRQAHKASFMEKYSKILPAAEADTGNETLSLIARLIGGMDIIEAQKSGDDDKLVETASVALGAAQQTAMEFERFLKPFLRAFEEPSFRDSRDPLKWMLTFTASTLFPGARKEPDLVFVPLPANYVSFLIEHLNALDHGERDTIFQPNQTGKHSHPYAWAKAREEAILHVCFMQGGGRTKTSSRELVGKAIGVASNTLRDWEREISDFDFDNAREAGRLEEQRINVGIPWPKVMDAHVEAMADRLSGKLPGFARWYREEFGKRHWAGAGD
ncbi:hypothetical protein [Mesorhizobium kowhaii]|uniref:Uncharacterized protein n=1 Tax=Mesorhizobium kowhaii TaxID=1300272 RepID=A0A2W7DPZ6_9HYPH|nr:hypothetical protein [Mesorhizobium kowhaii]PZV33386.1 hypothetical protein B5V02_39395 [Mesorhizobium kowhaii]